VGADRDQDGSAGCPLHYIGKVRDPGRLAARQEEPDRSEAADLIHDSENLITCQLIGQPTGHVCW
jgi:hypothetical protein